MPPTPTTTSITTTEPDPERLEAFVDRVLDDIKGHQVSLMATLGDRLGLFDALAEGEATSPELARRTGLDERYVREWLAGMTAAEYVLHEPGESTFRMTPEQTTVLAAEGTPVSLGGLFHENAAVYAIFDDLERAFRTGDGISLDRYPDSWWDGMERFTHTWFDNFLLDEWLPAADGVEEALVGGAHLADVGCGRGRALITILEAYPEVTAVGYDLSRRQLAGARDNAAQAGVADRVRFVRRDAGEGLDDTFDVVTSFDVAHDLADPDAVFAAIHEALRPGGSYLLLEFRVADRLEDNIGRNAAMFYGWSLTYCMTTSLADGGEALGTCGLPESEVRARCEKAGFQTVEVVPFDNPFNVLYQARA